VIVAESEMIEKITFEAFYDREMNPAPSGQPITAWKESIQVFRRAE